MELPFLNAYLQSVGAPSFQRGTNFAAAGCTILPAKPTSVSPFSFGLQIAQFLQFKSEVLQLLDGSRYFSCVSKAPLMTALSVINCKYVYTISEHGHFNLLDSMIKANNLQSIVSNMRNLNPVICQQ
jgi:hypothetical protein